jgi:hypothetical protein
MTPVYVCYHTPGPYAKEAGELATTLRQHDLHHEIVEVADCGSWVRNCARKASFVRDMLAKHEDRPIVYLDSDARVCAYPKAFDEMPDDVDVAVHYKDGTELLSGTLYFGNTSGSWEIVRQWCERCTAEPDVWDQKHLQRVVEDGGKRFNVARLPAPYCLIFDTMREQGPPVIEHTQASRRYKNQ